MYMYIYIYIYIHMWNNTLFIPLEIYMYILDYTFGLTACVYKLFIYTLISYLWVGMPCVETWGPLCNYFDIFIYWVSYIIWCFFTWDFNTFWRWLKIYLIMNLWFQGLWLLWKIYVGHWILDACVRMLVFWVGYIVFDWVYIYWLSRDDWFEVFVVAPCYVASPGSYGYGYWLWFDPVHTLTGCSCRPLIG